MNGERERLVELLKQNCHCKDEDCSNCSSNGICFTYREADYLLDNSVIAPPCKVGQTVFRIVKLYGDRKPIIVEGEVFEIALAHENGEIKKRFYFLEKGGNKIINRYSLWLDFDEIGKTAFFTKEEAEKVLKGGATNE